MSVRFAALGLVCAVLAAPVAAKPASAPDATRVYPAGWEQARADWLSECRRRHGNGNRIGGAVIGGIAGGVIGNRVAGRGDRTAGTIAGAALGAVAGGAIGDAAGKREARDWCEGYLERHTTWSPAPVGPSVHYGYAPVTIMVPVAYAPAPAVSGQRECTETVVTEEWVAVPQQRKRAPARRVGKRIPLR